jgi:hypothetical protein
MCWKFNPQIHTLIEFGDWDFRKQLGLDEIMRIELE